MHLDRLYPVTNRCSAADFKIMKTATGFKEVEAMINFNNYNLNDAFIRQADRLSQNTGVTQNQQSQQAVSDGESFQEILDKQVTSKISFSKHAAYRTEQRSIKIGQSELDKLGSACERASEKGIKDALMGLTDPEFIVTR